DGDVTTVTLITSPVHGSLTTFDLNGDFTYLPDTDFNGTDKFTYQVFDMYSMSNVVTVTISVGAVNDVPVAVGESYTIDEDTVLTINAPGLLANDSDPDGDPIQAAFNTN